MAVSNLVINLGICIMCISFLGLGIAWHIYEVVNKIIHRLDRLEAQMKTVKTHLKGPIND